MALGVGGLVMTINELINELQKYDGNLEIYHENDTEDELICSTPSVVEQNGIVYIEGSYSLE